VHGEPGLAAALRASEILFGAEVAELTAAELDDIFADVPSRELPLGRLAAAGFNVVDAFAETGLAKSKGEARRAVTGGGAYVNNRREGDIARQLTAADLVAGGCIVLRSGKKNYAVLRFKEDRSA
jgi:tyrosyl-tRNA synthetase